MIKIKNIFFVVIFYNLMITPSFSYLDPGSSSIILQAIIGMIAAVGTTIGIYWKKFKDFFSKLFKKKNKN